MMSHTKAPTTHKTNRDANRNGQYDKSDEKVTVEKVMDFKTALNANKTTKTSVKKSIMPIIEVTDKDVKNSITSFIDAQSREKIAKADKEFQASTIISYVRSIQDENAFNDNFSKSYQVKSDVDMVKFIAVDKFSINSDDELEFKKLLGKKFNMLMEAESTVTLKREIFEDEVLQLELMTLLGDKFDVFFDVDTTLKTKPDFDKNIYGVVKTQEKLDEVRVFAKQNKPSIR